MEKQFYNISDENPQFHLENTGNLDKKGGSNCNIFTYHHSSRAETDNQR